MQHVLSWSIKCGSILKYVVLFHNRGLHLRQVKVFHCSACRQQNRELAFLGESAKLFCSNYWQNSSVTAAVYYFHYNSHLHYHFHCNCKIQLYSLKIFQTTPLCTMIPCLFQPFLSSFYRYIFFLVFQDFRFLRPVKRLRIRLQPSEIF